MARDVPPLPDIVCPIPRKVTHEEARDVFNKVKKEMKGLQESAYRREAARRMGLSYEDYLAAWKKPDAGKKPKPAPSPTPQPPSILPVAPKPLPGPKLGGSALDDFLYEHRKSKVLPTGADPLDALDDLVTDARSTNPLFGRQDRYQNNCTFVVEAHEMRRRGYEFTAIRNPNKDGRGNSVDQELRDNWRTPEGNMPWQTTFHAHSELRMMLQSLPEGGRGWVTLQWKSGGAHVFNVEKLGGRVRLVEAQRGVVDDAMSNLDSYLNRAVSFGNFMRTDNLVPSEGLIKRLEARSSEQVMEDWRARQAVLRARAEAKRAQEAAEWEARRAAAAAAAEERKRIIEEQRAQLRATFEYVRPS